MIKHVEILGYKYEVDFIARGLATVKFIKEDK